MEVPNEIQILKNRKTLFLVGDDIRIECHRVQPNQIRDHRVQRDVSVVAVGREIMEAICLTKQQ